MLVSDVTVVGGADAVLTVDGDVAIVAAVSVAVPIEASSSSVIRLSTNGGRLPRRELAGGG